MNHKAKRPRSKFINKIRRYFYPVEYVIIIALSYFFSGVNYLVAGIYYSGLEQNDTQGALIGLGVVLLIMVPISIVDDRESMHSRFMAVCGIIIHMILCLDIVVVYSYAWVIVYLLEVFIGFIAVVIGEKILG